MTAIEYLLGLETFGIKLGLDNIRTIAATLAHPERSYRSIIVAGTNGKGSVTAMAEAGLRAAGVRTGRYTSPHLLRLDERFAVDGVPVDGATLEAVAGTVRDAIEGIRGSSALPGYPTFFEATTAVAFEIFRRAGVEVAVLEVGLGGRFDATNVVTPIAAAIVTIDLDHERYLGSTLAEIAAEKAGVIKPGLPVVCGETKPEAVEVIARVCREQGASLVAAGEGVRAEARLVDGVTALTLSTPARDYGTVELALRGRHQVQNAVVATRLLEKLEAAGLAVPGDAVRTALTTVDWPGRLDMVEAGGGRRVLFDAAHNVAGARALASYVAEAFPARVPIVLGVMRDKDAAGIVSALAPVAERFVCTAPSMARAHPAADLARVAGAAAPGTIVESRPSPAEALAAAWDAGRLCLVTGSLFLVGELLPHARGVRRPTLGRAP